MQLGWVDFSSQDRKKALDALSLIKTQGAVDELGLGIVRDSFANYFFPGTSTIQTRAKYFLILNNIFDDFSYNSELIKKGKRSIPDLINKFREEEYNCAKALSNNCTDKKGKRETGIIGGDPSDLVNPKKWIIRTPSVIYWNGLKTYGIINNINSVRDFIDKSLNQKEDINNFNKTKKKRASKNDDENDFDDEGNNLQINHYHVKVVDKEEDWIEKLTLSLSKKEASFLRKQITQNVSKSLLSDILNNRFPVEKYSNGKLETLEKDDYQKKFPHIFEIFSSEIKSANIYTKDLQYLDLACQFNKLSTLLRIRYNLILSNMENESYQKYWELYSQYSDDLKYNPELITQIYTIFKLTGKNNERTQKFLNDFLTCFNNRKDPRQLESMTTLIKIQEKNLKGKERAKLYNPQAYYSSSKPEWIGGYELDFRLANTSIIIDDIYKGLKTK